MILNKIQRVPPYVICRNGAFLKVFEPSNSSHASLFLFEFERFWTKFKGYPLTLFVEMERFWSFSNPPFWAMETCFSFEMERFWTKFKGYPLTLFVEMERFWSFSNSPFWAMQVLFFLWNGTILNKIQRVPPYVICRNVVFLKPFESANSNQQ